MVTTGCALCTTEGAPHFVRIVEIEGVLWPMCRLCERRLRANPPRDHGRLIEACARLAFSARMHGVRIRPEPWS